MEFRQTEPFHFLVVKFGQNMIIFGADMSFSVHANNRTKNILILKKGITQGLDDTTLTAEKIYSIHFTASRRKFISSIIMKLIITCL